MANTMTHARPYARAAFEYAKQQNALAQWLEILQTTGVMAQQEEVRNYIKNPKVSAEQVIALFADVAGKKFNQQQENFFQLLAQGQQFALLPDIASVFTRLYEENDEIVSVDVIAALEMSKAQQDKMQAALEKRIGKKIKLHCTVDASLLGGAIVRTPEWVMDGSVTGKLQQLKTKLVG